MGSEYRQREKSKGEGAGKNPSLPARQGTRARGRAERLSTLGALDAMPGGGKLSLSIESSAQKAGMPANGTLVVPIVMPPLRERKEDIPLLLESFISEFCRLYHKSPKTVSEGALEVLMNYSWPGNIRELRNLTERLVLLCRKDVIQAEDLPPQILESEKEDSRTISIKLEQPLKEVEKTVIRSVLASARHNRTLAARILGISLRALHYKIKRYGLDHPGR